MTSLPSVTSFPYKSGSNCCCIRYRCITVVFRKICRGCRSILTSSGNFPQVEKVGRAACLVLMEEQIVKITILCLTEDVICTAWKRDQHHSSVLRTVPSV